MKKQWKPWLFITSNILTVFNFLVFISIRSMWSGIIRYTAEMVPYLLLCVIFCFAFIHTIFSINKKYPALFALFSIIINMLFLALNGFIISLTLDAWMYFVREFLYGVGFLGILFGIYCSVIYLHSRAIFQKKWFPTALFLTLLIRGRRYPYYRISCKTQ